MRNYFVAVLAAILLLICAVALGPIWATNDDVALAMLGSGTRHCTCTNVAARIRASLLWSGAQ